MLTSHKYLLGSLIAVSCATGILSRSVSHSAATSQRWLPASVESAEVIGVVDSETAIGAEAAVDTGSIDVSHRGSGRISDTPNASYQTRGLIAHRGSGRIVPVEAL